jgi:hypothetical protein
MDTTELAANQFRMTQTRDKLARQGIHDQEHAIDTHKQVGREVREAIKPIGGTFPENLPPAEHIEQVEKRIKHAPPKLALNGPEAKGLAGEVIEKPGSKETAMAWGSAFRVSFPSPSRHPRPVLAIMLVATLHSLPAPIATRVEEHHATFSSLSYAIGGCVSRGWRSGGGNGEASAIQVHDRRPIICAPGLLAPR